MAAVAEGMLEYTLDVVKLEPGDRKCSTKTVPEESKSISTQNLKSLTTRGKQSCATERAPLFLSASHVCRECDSVML